MTLVYIDIHVYYIIFFYIDTENERNMWMTDAYPKIKLFCQELGYEFQVVDMRWGVRNESVDEHNGTEMCLREVQQCQRLSTGPNFIVSTSNPALSVTILLL